MALIECPECGWEVSDTAAACPKCAYHLGAGAPSLQSPRAVTGFTKSTLLTAASIVGRIAVAGILFSLARGDPGMAQGALGVIGLLVAGSAIPTWYRHKTERLKPVQPEPALPDDLADRILDMEHLHREQIAELEERIDFAERMLTKQREQIGPG